MMFKTKRENYRKTQRRYQLDEFFKTKRLQMSIPYSNTISRQQFQMFNKLNNAVNDPYLSSASLFDLVSDLRQLFINYSYCEQTFIVIANFLLNYPLKSIFLKELFLQNAQNFVQKGSFCFYWSFTIFVRAYFLIDTADFSIKKEQLKHIDAILGKNLQENVKKFIESQNQEQIENVMKKIQNLLQFFTIFQNTKSQENDYVLDKLLQTLVLQVRNLYKKSKQKQNCNPLLRLKFSLKIKQCILCFLQDQKMQFMKYKKYLVCNIAQIIYDSLREHDEEKDQIIQLISHLGEQFSLECGQYLIDQQIASQMIYILDSTRKDFIRKKILKFFSLIIKDIPRSKLIMLLNIQFHNKMAEILKVEVIQKNQELIMLALKNIRLIFAQIEQLNDQKLFYRCLNNMQAQQDFHMVLQQMTVKKYSQQVEKELSYILDSCYNDQGELDY